MKLSTVSKLSRFPSPIFNPVLLGDLAQSSQIMLEGNIHRVTDIMIRVIGSGRELKEDQNYLLETPVMARSKEGLSSSVLPGFDKLKQTLERAYRGPASTGGILPDRKDPVLQSIHECISLALAKKGKLMGFDHIVDLKTLHGIQKSLLDKLDSQYDQIELIEMAAKPDTYLDAGTLWSLLHCGIIGGIDKSAFDKHHDQTKMLLIEIAKYVSAYKLNQQLNPSALETLLKEPIQILTKVYLAGDYEAAPIGGSTEQLLPKVIQAIHEDDLVTWDMAKNYWPQLKAFFDDQIVDAMNVKNVRRGDDDDNYDTKYVDQVRDIDNDLEILDRALYRLLCLMNDAFNIQGAAVAYSQIVKYLGPDLDLFVFKRLSDTIPVNEGDGGMIKKDQEGNFLTKEQVMERFNLAAGNNDISYQGSSLIDSMAAILRTMIHDDTFNDKSFNKTSGLVELIKRHTGLSVRFEVEKGSPFPNAAVLPSYINPNHIYYPTEIRKPAYDYLVGGSGKDKKAERDKRNQPREGTINLATGKVSGWYSELQSPVYVTEARTWTGFSGHEIASVIVHELGHIFYCYYKVNQIVQDGTVLSRILKEVSSIKDSRQRKDVIVSEFNKLSIKVADPDTLTTLDYQGKEAELVGAIYVDGKIKNRAELKDTEYVSRLNEQLADHFAIMHGGGSHLATALDRLHRMSGGAIEQKSNLDFYSSQVFVILLLYLFLPFGILLILMYTFMSTGRDVYDDLPKRIANMRRALINEIKIHRGNPKAIEKLSDDIKVIEGIESQLKERKTFLLWWASVFNRGERRLNDQIRKHTVIEDLVSNQLFIESVKINRE